MPKPKVFPTDEEALNALREYADFFLVEIVKTYRGRSARSSAKRAARHPQFVICHNDGQVSVAELTPRPEDQTHAPD